MHRNNIQELLSFMKRLEFGSKSQPVVLLLAALFLFSVSSVKGQNNQVQKNKSAKKFVHKGAGNPYLPLWEHLPDGEPRVFEDPDNPGKYRAYIIGSHDLRVTSYCGPDIRAWSAPVEDLSSWRNEGPIFTYQIDGQWDVMYAPDLVEVKRKNGKKEYYLYPHSRGPNREAMVCKSSRPDGPFTPINLTEDGKRTVSGSILGFDPAVYIEYVTDPKDPDYGIGFRAYGFWGFQRSSAAQLDQNTMYSLRPGAKVVSYLLPASSRYGVLREPAGTEYPNIYPGEDLGTFNFFEASSIRKVGNKYVTVFSGYSGPEYGIGSSNSTLRYAYGDSPLGPWKSGGVVVDSRAPVLNKDGTALQTTNAGHNTHGSIELINGQWYVFYHRPPRGFGFARQPMVAPVSVKWDEKPVAEGGTVSIRAYDPYATDGLWTAKDNQGREYKGAEVTSEGFHFYGLDPYQYYSAGYASYLSTNSIQQDSWDIWDNHMPIEKVRNGHIIGYKYFGFGGLNKNQNGLKAFTGTKKGNNTAFNLFLTPKTDKSFKVNVWLDGPWDNATWKGKKIAEIVIPANSKQEVTQFTADVARFVDGLDKKHAIFLVAEGGETDTLFNLMGLGFSSKNKKLVRPMVPAVSIAVNGQPITIPATPVRSTNANGIVGYDIYQTTYKAPAGTTAVPKVTASSNNSKVKIAITQAESLSGTAVVKFDYNGVVKTYRVVYTSE
jgi:arabinoxylan arabinofuranohydrolase